MKGRHIWNALLWLAYSSGTHSFFYTSEPLSSSNCPKPANFLSLRLSKANDSVDVNESYWELLGLWCSLLLLLCSFERLCLRCGRSPRSSGLNSAIGPPGLIFPVLSPSRDFIRGRSSPFSRDIMLSRIALLYPKFASSPCVIV